MSCYGNRHFLWEKSQIPLHSLRICSRLGMYYCLKEFRRWNDLTPTPEEPTNPKFWLYGSIICALFFAIVALALFGARGRLARAIDLIKECGM